MACNKTWFLKTWANVGSAEQALAMPTILASGASAAGFTNAPTGSFESVNAGSSHSCGIKTDGSIVCWGDDTYGQSTPP